MLLIDYHITASPLHGLGLFTSQALRRGEIVWRFDGRVDRVIPRNELWNLGADEIRTILNHAEYIEERECFILGGDGDYYMNHSTEPTLVDCGDHMVASRDIPAGTELTCDYNVVRVLAFMPPRPEIASPDADLPQGPAYAESR